MLKRTCVQCGKEFEISQSEIAFFRKKKLSLPKRCKECRESNKQNKSGSNKELRQVEGLAEKDSKNVTMNDSGDQSVKKQKAGQQMISSKAQSSPKKKVSGRQRIAYLAAALLLALGGGGAALSSKNSAEPVDTKIEQEETISYEFRNKELLEDHYIKHGMDMGFASKEEYLEGANRVVKSPDVLQKTEAEDGDFVYYLEETNEFVVVSKDGYLRTYFNPSDGMEYYNRQ